jgi:predicted metal-dependent peptidase
MREIKKYLEKLGIEVIEDTSIVSAFSFFDEQRNKFTIRYNPNYSNETIEFLLLHEFMHIYREDLLKQDVITEIYNVASDCIINDILGKTHILPSELPPLTIHSLPNCCKKNYDFYAGAKPLYDHLIENHTEIKVLPSSCFQNTNSSNAHSELQRIKKQVLNDIKEDIKKSTSDVPNELKDSIKKEIERKKGEGKEDKGSIAGKGNSSFSIIPVKPSESSILKNTINKFLKQFRESENSMFRVKYVRLYRNSRIPNIPRDIPILTPVPLTFIIDVSGSMSSHINTILSTIAHYEKEFPVQKIFFSDNAIKCNERKYYNAGGGTQIKPALDLMRKTFMTVVFSDYEFFDLNYKEFVNALMKKTRIAILFDEKLRVKEVKIK